MIDKIAAVIAALGYKPMDVVHVLIRRLEPLKGMFVNLKGKSDGEIDVMFRQFNKANGAVVKGSPHYVSIIEARVSELLNFLEEYDTKYNLRYCEIEFKEVLIRPSYMSQD